MTNLEHLDLVLLFDHLSAETSRYSKMRRDGTSSEILAAVREHIKAIQAEIQRRKAQTPPAQQQDTAA